MATTCWGLQLRAEGLQATSLSAWTGGKREQQESELSVVSSSLCPKPNTAEKDRQVTRNLFKKQQS